MKKTSTIVLAIYAATNLLAQTVTSSWLQFNGNQTANVINGSQQNVGPNGSGVVWDFSSLQSASTATILTQTAPITVNGSANYSSATHASQMSNSGASLSTFYTLNGELFNDIGSFVFTAPDSLYDVATEGRLMYQFPFSFGSSFTDTYSFQNLQNGSVNTNTDGSVDFTVDGSGTLQLPGGVVVNDILRLKYVDTYSVSPTIPLPPPYPSGVTTKYQWVSPSYPGHVWASYTISNFDNQGDSFSFYYSIPENVSIASAPDALPIVAPNPASKSFAILNANSNVSYTILNALGQNVDSGSIQSTGSSSALISTEKLSNGMYFLLLENERGELFRKNLVIAN